MKAHKSGFTLIELLVVIVIIVILMGIALQVAKTAAERTRRAQTVRTMEALRNALAGYYSAYGQYPPTSGTAGNYLSSNGLAVLNGATAGELTNLPSVFNTHGLLYYLMAYNAPPLPNDPNPNLPWSPRSTEANTAQRWRHYLEDAPGKYVPGISCDNAPTNLNLSGSTGVGIGTTNAHYYARDGWNSDIQYQSFDPYQSYRLWSVNMTNGWEE